MPVTLVDRLPLPNLKVYSAGSVLLLSVAVCYAVNVTSDPNWRANATLHRQEPAMGAEGADGMEQGGAPAGPEPALNATRDVADQLVEVMTFMMQEPLCMWTVINMAYCTLALFGFLIQRLVFGRLRVAEAQRVKDKFWNYVFYKFIFVFGVLNVQYMDEVLLWCSWFTLIGFLHLLGQLCKDRFEYLSSSPNPSWWAQVRLLALVAGILAAAGALFAAALLWGLPAGRDTFAFMAAECALVGVAALHVAARFVLRAYDSDAAGPASYYTHLVFDAVSLVTEVCHVGHMVVYSNAVVSMASLVLLVQLRHLLHALLTRLRRHRLYAALATHMSRNYPMASPEEVEKNQDNCAICWEPMKEARKLPCAHLFHNSCLCRWVQQDASCPTCRRALSAAPLPPPLTPLAPHTAPLTPLPPLAVPLPPLAPLAPLAATRAQPRPNHLFHFDGSRYVSWLPSFSVEVTRVRSPAPPPATLDAMARQVQQMFPHYPLSVVAADLADTRSADLTVDNILEGRLPLPPDTLDTPHTPHTPHTPSPTPTVNSTVGEGAAANTSSPTAEVGTSTAFPFNFADLDLDDEARAEGEEASGTFPMVAAERERQLAARKVRLLAAARRRYLRTHQPHSASAPASAATENVSSAEDEGGTPAARS